MLNILPYEIIIKIFENVPLNKVPVSPMSKNIVKHIIDKHWMHNNGPRSCKLYHSTWDINYDEEFEEIFSIIIKHDITELILPFMNNFFLSPMVFVNIIVKYASIELFDIFYNNKLDERCFNIKNERLLEKDTFDDERVTKEILKSGRLNLLDMIKSDKNFITKVIISTIVYCNQKLDIFEWIHKNNKYIDWNHIFKITDKRNHEFFKCTFQYFYIPFIKDIHIYDDVKQYFNYKIEDILKVYSKDYTKNQIEILIDLFNKQLKAKNLKYISNIHYEIMDIIVEKLYNLNRKEDATYILNEWFDSLYPLVLLNESYSSYDNIFDSLLKDLEHKYSIEFNTILDLVIYNKITLTSTWFEWLYDNIKRIKDDQILYIILSHIPTFKAEYIKKLNNSYNNISKIIHDNTSVFLERLRYMKCVEEYIIYTYEFMNKDFFNIFMKYGPLEEISKNISALIKLNININTLVSKDKYNDLLKSSYKISWETFKLVIENINLNDCKDKYCINYFYKSKSELEYLINNSYFNINDDNIFDMEELYYNLHVIPILELDDIHIKDKLVHKIITYLNIVRINNCLLGNDYFDHHRNTRLYTLIEELDKIDKYSPKLYYLTTILSREIIDKHDFYILDNKLKPTLKRYVKILLKENKPLPSVLISWYIKMYPYYIPSTRAIIKVNDREWFLYALKLRNKPFIKYIIENIYNKCDHFETLFHYIDHYIILEGINICVKNNNRYMLKYLFKILKPKDLKSIIKYINLNHKSQPFCYSYSQKMTKLLIKYNIKTDQLSKYNWIEMIERHIGSPENLKLIKNNYDYILNIEGHYIIKNYLSSFIEVIIEYAKKKALEDNYTLNTYNYYYDIVYRTIFLYKIIYNNGDNFIEILKKIIKKLKLSIKENIIEDVIKKELPLYIQNDVLHILLK